jgi:hypothetical protein
MLGTVIWVEGGAFSKPAIFGGRSDRLEEELRWRAGHVRVVTGELGTEIKWDMRSPCFSSLFAVAEWLTGVSGPAVLRFFLNGWFEEYFECLHSACDRIELLITKSDLRLRDTVFVREFDRPDGYAPAAVRHALTGGTVPENVGVDCAWDETSGRFRVVRVGSDSVIGRLWGVAPDSYPCLSGGYYDMKVSAAYHDVICRGRPRYDHVIAAMMSPGRVLRWIPYQRAILPGNSACRNAGVTVVAEIAAVDIRVL